MATPVERTDKWAGLNSKTVMPPQTRRKIDEANAAVMQVDAEKLFALLISQEKPEEKIPLAFLD